MVVSLKLDNVNTILQSKYKKKDIIFLQSSKESIKNSTREHKNNTKHDNVLWEKSPVWYTFLHMPSLLSHLSYRSYIMICIWAVFLILWIVVLPSLSTIISKKLWLQSDPSLTQWKLSDSSLDQFTLWWSLFDTNLYIDPVFKHTQVIVPYVSATDISIQQSIAQDIRQNDHFRNFIKDREMQFDYKLVWLIWSSDKSINFQSPYFDNGTYIDSKYTNDILSTYAVDISDLQTELTTIK